MGARRRDARGPSEDDPAVSGLQQFDYGNWSVRTFVAADGQPWFVAADVCAALGFANRGQALATHVDPVDRGVHPVDTPGGTQNAVVINESGLYALAFGSRLETARTFKRWVTSEVLPALRTTGGYQLPTAHAEPAMPSYKDALRGWADAIERAEQAEHQVVELAPAADAWQSLEATPGDMSIRDAAQWLSNDPAISVGSVKLMAELRRLGWVDAKNVPYQSQITAGRMRRKSSTYIDPFGEEQVSITARLTVKGVRDLHRRLGGSQLPALALVSGGSL